MGREWAHVCVGTTASRRDTCAQTGEMSGGWSGHQDGRKHQQRCAEAAQGARQQGGADALTRRGAVECRVSPRCCLMWCGGDNQRHARCGGAHNRDEMVRLEHRKTLADETDELALDCMCAWLLACGARRWQVVGVRLCDKWAQWRRQPGVMWKRRCLVVSAIIIARRGVGVGCCPHEKVDERRWGTKRRRVTAVCG